VHLSGNKPWLACSGRGRPGGLGADRSARNFSAVAVTCRPSPPGRSRRHPGTDWGARGPTVEFPSGCR